MSLDTLDAAEARRLRGAILDVLYQRHRAQKSRLDAVMLFAVMRRDLLYDIGLNDVVTILQDLRERGCVQFTEHRVGKDGRPVSLGDPQPTPTAEVIISKVQITPRGRDLVERNVEKDPGIDFI